MSKLLKIGLFILITITLLPSCATIVGGSKYYAKVEVPNHPLAKIEHNGVYKGTGQANFKAVRKEANNFEITIKEEGCETQTTTFTQRQFRGWAFVGTVVTWTGLSISGGPWLPIPFGVIVDGAAGSWWKPDVNEKGVSKHDFNNYTYTIDYTACPTSKEPEQALLRQQTKADELRELKKLLDDGIITSEEFEMEKAKILEQE